MCIRDSCTAPSGKRSLDDVSLAVHRGECVLLVGRSGSGKTTITKCINGLVPSFEPGIRMEGRMRVCGLDPSACEMYELAKHVGSVFQNPKSQFFNLTSNDELAFGLEAQGVTADEIERRAVSYTHLYFNPIGAHESGLIGEDPKGIPNNLLPYVAQVAVGKLECVGVFGDDYPTPDGTGVRDYIHVVDLARGHVAALDWMGGKVGTGAPSGPGAFQGEASADGSRRGVGIFNLGTGKGSSVLDVIHAFERACGRELPYQIKPRRAGDVAENYAACDKAHEELGWVAQYDLDRMCADSWRWQSMNPDGYATAS